MSATTAKNLAAFFDGPSKPVYSREVPVASPGPQDVLIHVHAVAINPVDGFRQARGIYIEEDAYPYSVGTDAAGIVENVGESVTAFKTGDRVAFMGNEWATRDPSRSAFHRYALTNQDLVVQIPDSTSFQDASVLPLCLSTATGMLFEKESLDLAWPTTDTEARTKHSNEVVVVWGASSSVGCCAIQLLKAAGYRTVGLSSPRNFDLVKQAGAERVFPYSDKDVVQQVIKYVSEHKYHLAGVASCTPMNPGVNEACADIARGLPGVKAVATAFPRGVPAMPVPDLGEGIAVYGCNGASQPDIRDHLWKPEGWFEQSLANGDLKCLPPPEVVGHGIESIPKAMDLILGGVSGKKLVVTDL